MKKIILCLALFVPFIIVGQQTDTQEPSTFNQFLNNLSGSFESNAQWYVNDKTLGDFEDPNTSFQLKDEQVRVNSYLRLDYGFLDNFTVGIQVESYEPLPLINYYEGYNETNLAAYYANFKNETLDITAGYFYEQFGSGLLLRAYEERQLGLNNALRGGRVKYAPTDFLNFTALYGQQRLAFDVSEGNVYGFDTNIDLANALNIENVSSFNFGLSYVGKQEDFTSENEEFDTTDFPEMVNSFSARFDIDFDKFYINTEYSIKGEDIVYTPPSQGPANIIEGEYFKGNSLLFTAGYTKKGLGISGTFRRLENMSFFSERDFSKPGNNVFNMLSMNYIPALTKQQDYSLANIYIYQAQPALFLQNFAGQAGEIGGQFDLFYNFTKGTSLGGKYGTKFTANFSYWALLDTEFNQAESTYNTGFLKFGDKLYKDLNFEIRKKWSKNWNSIFTYINSSINKNLSIEGSYLPNDEQIKSNIVIAEATHKLGNGKSVRLEAQHLWTKQDDKNWAGGTLEYNASRKFSFYVTDMYNYGNDIKDDHVHFYNLGGSFTKGSTRVALNYGRQRGGLLCVGGVCRIVPENTGLTLNLTTSF